MSEIPDPHRTITPGGFHVESPFSRQFVAPQPVEKPAPTTKPETVVDMGDLEEVNEQLLDLIHDLSATTAFVGHKDVGELRERLETIHNLIYRNLR